MSRRDGNESSGRVDVSAVPGGAIELRGIGGRLVQADMWVHASRLLTVAVESESDPATTDRLNAAWACLCAGDVAAAKAMLDRVDVGEAPVVAVMVKGIAALSGDESEYASLLSSAFADGVGDAVLRVALAAATARADIRTAARLAQRLSTYHPSMAEVWVAMAAQKAVEGDYGSGVDAVKVARTDRFACQTDPAETVTALLRRAGHEHAAILLAAAGAAREGDAPKGWPGWIRILDSLAPRRLRDRYVPVAVLAVAVPALSAWAGLELAGRDVVALSGLAAAVAVGGAFLHWMVDLLRPVNPSVSTVARAARSGRARHRVAAFGSRLERVWCHDREPFSDPHHCSCWESQALAGDTIRDYVDEHLVPVWDAPVLGVSMKGCPDTGQKWIVVDNFAIRTPDGPFDPTTPAAPVAATPARPDPASGSRDGLKVGQYL